MPGDPEIDAMSAVTDALEGLPAEAQARVLSWAGQRYNIAISAKLRTEDRADDDEGEDEGGDAGEAAGSGSSAFADFADLFDAVNPSSDTDRALTGGYWFQVVRGNASFQAQQVNNALKDVGHGVENIARALSNLQDRSPALVRQLSKSGRTKQARKTYKLTAAGVSAIASRLPQG